jgi:hypothetical protein
MTPDDLRDYVVSGLDLIRRQERLVASSKAHFLKLADDHGVRAADIAEAIGMSIAEVRDAISHARARPPFLGAGDAAGSLPEAS